MFCEVESQDVKLLFKGTFLKNSKEILKNLDKFPDSKEVTHLELHDFSPQNYEANLYSKNIPDESGEGKKQDVATKDVKKGKDDLELFKIAKNLKEKVGLDDANAHETSVNNENELLDDLKTETTD